ncbi:hypothetical protein GCM10011572_11410 [Pseudoduganella buxea]|uniref:Pentapeptide repeat-containing protein n=1 Tax=Pseudoduganella buxea TaxID=1949069 RepID=A0ABQ1KAU1_9BURK|nr:hypothetical protein GCM10011572_11410 [Pseudoduganella buxea]
MRDVRTDFAVRDVRTDFAVRDVRTDFAVRDVRTDFAVRDVRTDCAMRGVRTDFAMRDVGRARPSCGTAFFIAVFARESCPKNGVCPHFWSNIRPGRGALRAA